MGRNGPSRARRLRQRVVRFAYGLLFPFGPRPASRIFGLDRGLPVDRYYIARFLERHAADVRGNVLEVGSLEYTRVFGGERVGHADLLHVDAGAQGVSVVGNLETGAGIPRGRYDCFIMTQTLQVLYEASKAIANAASSLRSGGVLLATFPGICQISRYDSERWGDYWRFTEASAKRLFEHDFPGEIEVEAYGNLAAACALLAGLAAEEVGGRLLDQRDEDYPVVIGVRARLRGGAAG